MIDVAIRKRTLFTESETRALYDLHAHFFANSKWEKFATDFSAKDWVIVLRDDRKVVGFSTIDVTPVNWQGTDIISVFSGDTIVHPDYWQSNALTPAFGKFILYCDETYPSRRVVWHLISKGYRTYRLLPVFFNQYYPSPEVPTPPEVQSLLDYLSERRFGECYDPANGLIRFPGETDRLSDELAEIAEERKSNRHIRFFLERNPDYRRGDELSCITDLEVSNIKPLARRMISRCEVTWERG